MDKKTINLSRTLSTSIIRNAWDVTELMFENFKLNKDGNFNQALIECLSYFVYKAERLVYLELGDGGMKDFMELFLGDIGGYLPTFLYDKKVGSVEEIDKLSDEFMKTYVLRVVEYQQYKQVIPEKGEGFKGYVNWEAGKVFAEACGKEEDVFVNAAYNGVYGTCLKLWEDIIKSP